MQARLFMMFVVACLTLLLCLSCSSLPKHAINTNIGDRDEFMVDLKEEALLGIYGTLKKGASCSKMNIQKIDLEIKNSKTGEKSNVSMDCKSFQGAFWVRSTNFIKPGRYEVEFSQKDVVGSSNSPAQLKVRFRNPEFQSGADQVLTGSLSVSGNQTVSESVAYNSGDRTDWYVMDGDSERISLGFDHLGGSKTSYAYVYKKSKNSKRLKYVTKLRGGSSKVFVIRPKTNLYVRVRSHLFSGPSKYVLRRKDLKKQKDKKKVRTVQVIDCFPVDDRRSMAVISGAEGLSVGDSVEVLGKRVGGRFQKVGTCLVSSIFDSQASCHLETIVRADFSDFMGKVN